MPKTQAIIYARFSPRPNAGESESIETQFEACEEYCNQQNYRIRSKYCDRAISGADEDRPGLWDAVADLKSGDVLVVYKLDRLARSVFLSHTVERMARKVGATIRSIKNEGTWGDSPEDRVLRNILRSFDEYYREANAKRISDAMRRHVRNGRIMTDPKRLPYGWMIKSMEKRTMKPHPEEMEVIGQIREMSERSESAYAIANTLNDAGLLPRSGKWTVTKILRVIRTHRIPYPSNPDAKTLKPKQEDSVST